MWRSVITDAPENCFQIGVQKKFEEYLFDGVNFFGFTLGKKSARRASFSLFFLLMARPAIISTLKVKEKENLAQTLLSRYIIL